MLQNILGSYKPPLYVSSTGNLLELSLHQDRVENNYEPPQQKHKEESLTTVLSINIFIDVEEKNSTFHHIKY